MTEREAEIRRWVATGDIVDRHDAAYLLTLLDAERQGRALPVLRTCGDCGWRRPEPAQGWRCGHPDSRGALVHLSAAPPSSCPLREVKP